MLKKPLSSSVLWKQKCLQ